METELVNAGLDTVYTYDNIAIVVLMVCLMFSGCFNIMLVGVVFKIKDTLASLANAIVILNERLKHHEDN